jgi:hypothetical protein
MKETNKERIASACRWASAVAGVLCVSLMVLGCDAFNPAFVDFVGSNFDGVDVTPQGPDSAGHVVIAFRNDTVFDEQMLDSLIAQGLERSLTEGNNVRPRIRMLLNIVFTNDEMIQVEFNDGSASIVDPRVDLATLPELTRGEKNNIVVQCDVARVELMGLPSIFVPIFFETIRIDPGDELTRPFRVQVNSIPPQFQVLRVDDIDNLGNTVLLRNIDIRDLPAPAIGPNCGSVVTISISGTLRSPFVVNEFGALVPGVLNTNGQGIAANPGRFDINVGIR